MYGNRVAWQEIALVTCDDPKSIFHKTGVWKQGLIANVTMLARCDMIKPARGKYGADSRFTRVQEMKQDQLTLTKVCFSCISAIVIENYCFLLCGCCCCCC